jgi:chromosome segregation ATPase
MFEKKTLQQHIDEFVGQVNERNNKIRSKIKGFEAQADSIETTINEQSSTMVELELAGDTAGAEKLQKNNRQLRLQLEEVRDSIKGYQSQLGKRNAQYNKELDKVRVASNKAREERFEHGKKLIERREALENQLSEMKQKIESLRHEIHVNDSRTEVSAIRQLLPYIDSRSTKLGYLEQDQFIINWMGNGPLESFFEKPKEYGGIRVTYDNVEDVNYRFPTSANVPDVGSIL